LNQTLVKLCYILFIPYIFNEKTRELEKEKNSVIEVMIIIKDLKAILNQRLKEKFIPLKVKMILQDNLKDGLGSEHYKEQMMNCYRKCYDYLDLWTEQFNYLEDFQWMGLTQEPLWENVEKCIQFLNSKSISIDDTKCFDQFCNLKFFYKEMSTNSMFQKKNGSVLQSNRQYGILLRTLSNLPIFFCNSWAECKCRKNVFYD
jgi:hypothetical protein